MTGAIRPRLEGARLKAIEDAITAGESDREVSRRHGASRNTAARIRRRLGVAALPAHGSHNRALCGKRGPRKQDGPLEIAMRANHAAGLTDYDSAKALGVERWQVQGWRRRWSLPANSTPGGGRRVGGGNPPRATSLNPDWVDIIRGHWAQGHADPIIARVLGVHRDTVRKYRKRLGLAGVGIGGSGPRSSTQPAWRDPLWSACKRAVGDKLSADIVDDAVSEMVLAVLEGRLDQADVPRMGRRYGSRAIQQWADRRGPLSLDEDRNGEGWTRYAALPCPDAETSFRVIELSRLAVLSGVDVGKALA